MIMQTNIKYSAAPGSVQVVGENFSAPDSCSSRQVDEADANDLHVICGADSVSTSIEAALPDSAEKEPSDDESGYPDSNSRPCWRVYKEPFATSTKLLQPGVYYHDLKSGKSGSSPMLIDKWVCSPLWVRAVTRNGDDAEYGRLVEILSTAGLVKKWSMPMSMLAGDATEVRAVLLSEGLTIDTKNPRGVIDYIVSHTPSKTMRSANVTGWHYGAFVLPDAVIGAADIWFQATGRTAPYAAAGTFEGWQQLAVLASGNPLLMLSMSAAFAGPLLHSLNIEGGGLHLVGDSSTGKTTAIMAGISVWGGSSFKRTWRATANGLEGAGALHSDTLLALDEIGEVDPRSLYESAYALINGVGKTRANKLGEARQAARWRVFLLSTGEVTVAARMAAGGIEAKAGQSVRILDIPVAGKYGLFDELHGRASGSVLSDEVRHMASTDYGHAGPRFVECLIRALDDGFTPFEELAKFVEQFDATADQERRAARTFALCALAGELATTWGLVPWQPGDPTKSAKRAFDLWRKQRGEAGRSSEHISIVRALVDFIDRHGDARFSNVIGQADLMIRDRAGYWQQVTDRKIFLFTSAGLREAAKGHDITRVTRALDEAGAIYAKDTDRHTKTMRTHGGEPKRLYCIDPEKLRGDE